MVLYGVNGSRKGRLRGVLSVHVAALAGKAVGLNIQALRQGNHYGRSGADKYQRCDGRKAVWLALSGRHGVGAHDTAW